MNGTLIGVLGAADRGQPGEEPATTPALGGAGYYNVIEDFGITDEEWFEGEGDDVSASPYWIMAVIRIGQPLSFSRAKMASVDSNIIGGALLRSTKPLVVTDDCFNMQIQNTKRSHTKSLHVSLRQTSVNYLVEILPGDWVMAWIMNNETDYLRVLDQIDTGKACNGFRDGLKFVGRIGSVRKSIQVDRSFGHKTAVFNIAATGFQELDTMLFYDYALAQAPDVRQAIGQWLGRLGMDIDRFFALDATKGILKDNINVIIPTLIDLIVGKGPKTDTRQEAARSVDTAIPGRKASDIPQLDNSAPFSYLIPLKVGQLLGVQGDATIEVMGYADILEQLMGVQNYPNRDGYKLFVPQIKRVQGNRRFTPTNMLGTFPPMMPEFTNRPLWQVLQQFLNPTINEMYTALRVNPAGQVMPTLVVRQIPFTTEVFDPGLKLGGNVDQGAGEGPIPCTRFLSLPRWFIPDSLVNSIDIGRSDHTRFNFVHIYGQFSAGSGFPLQYQLVNNPPIRDDIDIMRSGLRSYMTTVECFTSDQVGSVPGIWMALVADFVMGSQYTLNGTLACYGIQSPICEGDNIEFDGVVYHIESVSHQANIDHNGQKNWSTTLTLTNGMRAEVEEIVGADSARMPIYPAFAQNDNMSRNPGLSEEQSGTAGGDSRVASDPEAQERKRQLQEAFSSFANDSTRSQRQEMSPVRSRSKRQRKRKK